MPSTYSSEHLEMDAFELWKFFFQEPHALEVKTTFRPQKPHCEKVWWKHIKNERCKCYLCNKEQKAKFLVVSRSHVHFGFEHSLFLRARSSAQIKLRAKNLAHRKKSVHPWNKNLHPSLMHLYWYLSFMNIWNYSNDLLVIAFSS